MSVAVTVWLYDRDHSCHVPTYVHIWRPSMPDMTVVVDHLVRRPEHDLKFSSVRVEVPR